MKNSLKKKGLSMSSAQSISNLCFQRARTIDAQLDNINNAEVSIKVGDETYYQTVKKEIPSNLVALLTQKAGLHAVQGFLMENIKAKDNMLNEIKNRPFLYEIEAPERPKTEYANTLGVVGEAWGKDQLSLSEINEFLEVEAIASHIGQFIHKGSTLDRLRTELPTLSTLQWISMKDGERTPMKVTPHHTIEQLAEVHEELAGLHRNAEKRVNFFKAKIKDLVTLENARIAQVNADEIARVNGVNQTANEEYRIKFNEYQASYQKASQDFEAERNKELKEKASLKIEVPERFKPLVDEFLSQLDEE
jgi:hypothetical protein